MENVPSCIGKFSYVCSERKKICKLICVINIDFEIDKARNVRFYYQFFFYMWGGILEPQILGVLFWYLQRKRSSNAYKLKICDEAFS